jgi:alkylation response protein AidB-like acyl-CoA dehydrogenase
MTVYTAPLDEMRFVLYDVLGADKLLTELPGHEDHGADLINTVLAEAAKFCEEQLLPLNRTGDEEGCSFENGVVRTPKGFKQAYETFAGAGWTGLACRPEDGGQDLPKVVNLMVEEMVCSTNLSFGTYPGLSLGAYNAIKLHAAEELKRLYLPKLADGSWSGTMCLTEPQCGTDLGLIRTRAEPQGDGTFAITGTKIFISAGEHDLTRNIVHLVLARLPDAPAGTRGISLFLVPKFLPRPDGSEGQRNGVACGGIEHKMGLKASATCVLNFDGAKGWLIGEAHKGMRAMFTMMNAARLAVGIQGLGIAETAYQSARAYARERLQGRALNGAAAPDKPADPIIVHPDVRRLLLTIKANTEAARALALWVGLSLDIAERHADAQRRQEADDLVQLMTPIVKATLTDLGFTAANHGLQVFGGHGYIREWGMEQLVRDARITQLYEGTNGIQALDLVGRKLPTGTGRLLRRFFHPAMALVEEHQADPAMAELVIPFAKALGRLQQATAWLAQAGLRDPNEGGAAASEYLRLFALTALAYMWVRMAKTALARPGDAEFARTKLATARFFMARLLPETGALFQSLMTGAKPLMEIEASAF